MLEDIFEICSRTCGLFQTPLRATYFMLRESIYRFTVLPVVFSRGQSASANQGIPVADQTQESERLDFFRA